MPVPALELKPRGPLALFDSALRLCARSSGLWALALPGGAAVVWAVLRLSDALAAGSALVWPVLGFTLAWLLRGVFQAAACHFLEQQLVGAEEPTAPASLRAALARLPSVIITAAYLPLFTAASVGLTLGIGYFFFSSHLAGWAAVLKGKGHPLALYATCSRLLGPTRGNATGVRVLFGAIVLFGVNLHIAATFGIYLLRKLGGLELTFLQRFVSLDNGQWALVVAALSFAAFEPLRAAVATLLLIDARVRQEGLDLMAAVEQLPRRRSKPALPPAAAVVLLVVGALWPIGARASEASLERLREAAASCEYPLESSLPASEEGLDPAGRAALARLADEVEERAYEGEDCEAAAELLERAIPQVHAAAATLAQTDASAAERAQEILRRPEFAPPPVSDPEDPEDRSAWARFWEKVGKWLEELFKGSNRPPARAPDSGAGLDAAQAIALVLGAGAVIGVAVLLALGLRSRGRGGEPLEVAAEPSATGAGRAPEGALARAPEGWAQLADQLAADGRFREAVRSLYLALLSRLHRLGAIDYDPSLSNWDYCRQLRAQHPWLPTFRELTSRFDFAWYGEQEVGRDGYAAFRALTEPLLTERAGPPQGGPGA